MSGQAHFHWFLPTSGDGREVIGGLQSAGVIGTASAIRPPSLDYLALVAKTAEHAGFESVLTPTGTWCHDAWLTTAALIRETTRLKFLVAFRPGLITPTLAAQQGGNVRGLLRRQARTERRDRRRRRGAAPLR